MKLESSCDLVEAIWDGIATENSPYQWAATVFGATVLLSYLSLYDIITHSHFDT
jgi:hypothetical protein